jgi:HD-GYP domain-containing protein (c-di-GMP phosphodiesterase class II)
MSSPSLNAQWRTWRAELAALSPEEANHADRVAVYAVATAEQMGLSDEELLQVRFAAAVHDLGKLDLPAELFAPRRTLSATEVIHIRQHPALGATRLTGEWEPLAPFVKHHHERWDGRGYPDGLAGESIPLAARIISVAEAFDAMTHTLSARMSLSEQEAINELRRNVRKQFDARVVSALIEVQPLIQPVEAS